MGQIKLWIALQILGTFVADGILSYDPPPPSTALILPDIRKDFPTKPHHQEVDGNTWQTLLKTATFRTLIKYTVFSPSLDFKMEADSLLWEKLNGARYTQKQPKPHEGIETLKTGVLIDLTRENGHLEFRQVENSLYSLVPKDHRLLAIWRIKTIQPEHYIIQIKVPEEPPIEHYFEYTKIEGLKETHLKTIDQTKSKVNKQGGWKIRQRKAYAPSIGTKNVYTKQPQPYVVTSQPQQNVGRYKSQQQTYRNSKSAKTYLYKPTTTQYYTVVGVESPPPVQTNPTWSEYLYPTTYPTTTVSTEEFTEFKQQMDYDGFVPSLGPTAPIINYPAQISPPNVAPVAYKQPTTFFPAYTVPQTNPQSPYPLTYFKPSTEFVQYSEVDPFYTTPNESAYNTFTVINTAGTGLSLLGQIPLYYNSAAAITVQGPNTEPGTSLYDTLLNTIKNENETYETDSSIENLAQPTATTYTVDYFQERETFQKPEHSTLPAEVTTVEILKPTVTELGQYETNFDNIKQPTTSLGQNEQNIEVLKATSTNPGQSKTRIKNSLRNPSRTVNSGIENYEYAPLYVKWGEKIRPSEKLKTTTTIAPKSRTERPITQKNILTNQKTTTEKRKENSTENPTLDESLTTNKPNITQINEFKNNNFRNSTERMSPSERLQELQKQRIFLKNKKLLKEKLEEFLNKTASTGEISNLNSSRENLVRPDFKIFENSSNYIISNITSRSPEEIVIDYTTIGLQNVTSTERSENLRSHRAQSNAIDDAHPAQSNAIDAVHRAQSNAIDAAHRAQSNAIYAVRKTAEEEEVVEDSENADSEPVSVVVSTISQSYSYRTAEGESKNLRQLIEKT